VRVTSGDVEIEVAVEGPDDGPAVLSRPGALTARFVTGPWRYERLDGVGHWMQLEAPDAVSSLLIDHLAG
jgi:pimeloyl-ACP methyl ester carboxylesterase